MRSKTIGGLILIVGSSMLAGTSAAQRPAQPPPAQEQQRESSQQTMRPEGMGLGMMGMMSERSVEVRRVQGPAGLFERVSRLQSALDDPQVRTALGLTDQQADSLRKLIVDTETFTIKTGADIAVNSIELRELLRADKPDRSAVKSKGDQISKSTSLLINHYLDAMLEAKALLTPEQQEMVRAYMERGGPAFPSPPARP